MSWLNLQAMSDYDSVRDHSSDSDYYYHGDGDFDQYRTLRDTKGTLQQLVEDGRPPRRGDVVPPMQKEKGDLIAARARTHPVEASFPNSYGYYPLHAVLEQKPPLHVVEAVFNAYPAALLKARKNTVLQIACNNRWYSREVVRFLARKLIAARARGDEMNKKSRRKLSSFGWVRRSRISVEAVKVLLEEDPTVSAYEDRNVGLFIMHYFCDLGELRNNESYEKLKLFLMAHAHGTMDEGSLAQRGITFRPLHALLRCMVESTTNPQCERLVNNGVTQFMERGERDFTEKDFTGSYPINILIESPRKTKVATAFLEDTTKLLLREHPASATYSTACGRLPLHLAIENGWPTSPILAYAQSSISVRDVSTGLFPFQAAAAACTSRVHELVFDDCVKNASDIAHDILSSVELSYQLLRADPILVCSSPLS